MLWTTAPEGEPGDRLSLRFGKADRVINVIDTRQSYPQQVVIECLRQTGFEKQADRSVHLAYEVVNLSPQAARILGVEEAEDKKAVAMSDRAGTGVKAMDFIGLVKRKVVEKSDHALEEQVASALNPSLHKQMLVEYITDMWCYTQQVTAQWKEGAVVDILDEMRKIALRY